MRIKSVKKLLWTANAVLVVGLILFVVFGFVLNGPGEEGPLHGPRILRMAENTGGLPPLADRGPGPFASYRFSHQLAINGFPPVPKEPEVTEGPAPEVSPLARDYELVWVKTDPDILEEFAHLARKNTEMTVNVRVGGKVERTGWKLVDTRADEVHGYADFEHVTSGEKVTLEQPYTSAGPLAADGAGGSPGGGTGGTLIGSNYEVPDYNTGPDREPVRVQGVPNRWKVPEEAQLWTEKHWERMAEETEIEVYTNPQTREPAGLLLKSLPKNKGLEKYGILSGDVLISLNGNPMTSKQEAMRWLKGEGKGLPRYVAVVLRKGREVTLTYDVPQKDR